jgi:hypothetical protein
MALNLFEELEGLTRALDEAGIPYALCGGLAMAVYGVSRATIDIDILVDEADIERLEGVERDGLVG